MTSNKKKTSKRGAKFGYVSDETIAFDDELRVFPYRKPLSVVTANRPKRQLSPTELGLQPLPEADLRLAGVVLLDRVGAPVDPSVPQPERPADADATLPSARRVSLVEALSGIVAHTSYLSYLDRPLQRLAAIVDATGGFYSLRYREAADVADFLPELTSLPEQRESWRPIDVSSLAELEVHDAIGLDSGAAIVLVCTQLQVLGELGAEVWRRMLLGEDSARVQQAILERFGAPPAELGVEVSAHIDGVIAELRATGLLPS